MAETPEETTEASADEVGRGDERSEAGTEAPEAEATEAAAPEAPAKPGAQTRREKLEARRAERSAKPRPQRTPEERQAEREERRRHTAEERRRYRARLRTKKAELRKSKPAAEPDHASEHGPGRAKVRQGIVVSDKADKTITVRIDVVRRHRRYHKIMRTSIKLHAHDERNDAGTGDTVRVQECRPMSRSKRWRLIEVVERAK
jgi:small subunit ribosomal protein S17